MNDAVLGVKPSAIRVFSALANETPGCIALTLGEPDFDTPMPVRQAAIDSLIANDTHYIQNNGHIRLREAVCAFERDRYGMDYAPDEVIVTSGATEGLFAALFSIIRPGDEVLVPTPAFGLYRSIIELCRGVFRPIPTEEDGFQLSAEAVKRALTPRTKALILNSPNNPTGCVYTEETLKALHDVLKDAPVFVITDDVYRQLCYLGGDAPSFSIYRDMRDRLIVVQSFSKPYAMTGWRLGYLLCDRDVALQIGKVHQFSVVSTASFSQKAGIQAFSEDPTPMRETYRARRDYALSRLDAMGLECVAPQGAFYLFPSIARFGMDSETFCRRMIAEAGLATTPGSCFGCEGHIRLTYCYSMDQLREGLDRLARFIHILES